MAFDCRDQGNGCFSIGCQLPPGYCWGGCDRMEDDVRVGTTPYNIHNIHYPVARTASPGMLLSAFCSQGSSAAAATNPQMPLRDGI